MCETLNKTTGEIAVITDRDSCIAVAGTARRELAEKGEPAPRVVMTGGISRFIAPYCREAVTVDPDLLLKGLWLLYQKNVRRKEAGR